MFLDEFHELCIMQKRERALERCSVGEPLHRHLRPFGLRCARSILRRAPLGRASAVENRHLRKTSILTCENKWSIPCFT